MGRWVEPVRSRLSSLKWKNVDATKNKETLQPQDDCWASANRCLTASEGATEWREGGGGRGATGSGGDGGVWFDVGGASLLGSINKLQ